MEPDKKIMYELLKRIIPRLAGQLPILYFPQNKEHESVYHYLAREGYITLFPGDEVTSQVTGQTTKLPCQPVEGVTEKGYDFVRTYESRWKVRLYWWCGAIVGFIGLVAAVLTIYSFAF